MINGEIEIMRELSHSNIIKIFNAFKSDDLRANFIISELSDSMHTHYHSSI